MTNPRTLKSRIAAGTIALGLASLLASLNPTIASAEPFGGTVYNDRTTPKAAFTINHHPDYVPQGLAYGKGYFFQTQYNASNPEAGSLILIHRKDGSYWKSVYIAHGHVGGAEARGGTLYVVDNVGGQGKLRTYSIKKILATEPFRYVSARSTIDIGDGNDAAGAFIGIHGKRIYFGSHTKDDTYTKNGRMWHVDIGARGLPGTPSTSSVSIPPNVQGVVVSGDSYLFSQSWDRDCWSRFRVTSRQSPGSGGKSIYAPSMSEDLTRAKGKVWITYESAAPEYEGARNPVKNVHRGNLKKFVFAIWTDGWTSAPSGSCK